CNNHGAARASGRTRGNYSRRPVRTSRAGPERVSIGVNRVPAQKFQIQKIDFVARHSGFVHSRSIRRTAAPMLASTVTAVVRFCTRFPLLIIALAGIAAAGSVVYSVRHFAINTDINKLISPDLDWRKREAEFEKAFPGHFGSTLVVVEAPTTEYASLASAELTKRLAAQPELFRSVEDMSGSEFFARNGLLFRSSDDIAGMTKGLGQAAPLIGTLVSDPSLRGLTRVLSLALIGVQNRTITLDTLARPLSMAAATIEAAIAGHPASFSWQELLNGTQPVPGDLRRFIEVHPVLNFSALEPGRASSDAIRKAVSDLQLELKDQARVRLTGSVPMADEEF